MNKITLLIAFIWLACTSMSANADSCYLKNRGSFDAEVRVFDEQSGNLLWRGTLGVNERVSLSTRSGRIRYEYFYPPQDATYHSNTGAWCEDNREVVL